MLADCETSLQGGTVVDSQLGGHRFESDCRLPFSL